MPADAGVTVVVRAQCPLLYVVVIVAVLALRRVGGLHRGAPWRTEGMGPVLGPGNETKAIPPDERVPQCQARSRSRATLQPLA